MEIISLNTLKYREDIQLYELNDPKFAWLTNIPFNEYTVEEEDEMRIDLLFSKLYNIEYELLGYYLSDVDVILYINNIDNPLMIRKGMIILYPEISRLSEFRYKSSDSETETKLISKLAYIDKKTRTDKNRQKFIESEYILTPVVLDTPKQPVRIVNGNFSIGGL